MSTLHERVHQDLQDALRKGDTLRRDVLRLVRSALTYEQIAKNRPLTEEEAIAVLQREVKQRRESIEAFRQGGREDLATKEEKELAILLEYLPHQLSREDLIALAQRVIQETGAKGPADKGKVMGRLMPQVRGKADGATVSAIVSALLEGKTP
ncbi:MAG: GatB/YqeY domain-containing protein [Dehalococcoidia bacterium]|nr:GatB/YqeY domain-containing protein [Dehalococcoidia bacterium]MDW8120448.1 GatB/YqeY domain-containing protein [Chloroflexota bacterium]